MKQEEIDESKARRGWYFACVFLVLVVALILFLARVEIVAKNRDVLVGILGVITGSISSMMAIASGRDPSEVEELRDKLGRANADREALIARLRDAQIQLQLHRDQLAELQTAIIERLSVLAGPVITSRDSSTVELDPNVEQWLPESRARDAQGEREHT